MAKKILVILTSAATIEGSDKKIGWYLPEFADPYWVLSPHFELVVASPKGGIAPVDPDSVQGWVEDRKEESSIKFFNEKKDVWQNTEPLANFLGQADEYVAIFYAGGHGPMFDIALNADSQKLVREFWESGKPVAAVCAGVSALSHVALSNGEHLLKGKQVTGLSKAELAMLPGFTELVPFALEDKLTEVSAGYSKAEEPWDSKVVVSGRLITGQNPASAKGVAEALLAVLS